jgi:coniferyl-aldehyde dehydrogenase
MSQARLAPDFLTPSPPADLQRLLQAQRVAHAGTPHDYAQRRRYLDALETAIKTHRDRLTDALNADFGNRSRHESLLTEIVPVLNEIRYTRKRLKRWIRPRHVNVGWQLWPARGQIVCQPLGVVGIVAPWNYPVNLTLWPLVSALAAGNHVMIKPSENAPETANALRSMLGEAFDPEVISVVTGGPDVAGAFCALPFDHLLFTGSERVARKVLVAAADNLTPVTLELGGKSPTIVDRDFPIKTAAERIMTGKLMNAGQTCNASDYLLLHESLVGEFVTQARNCVQTMYPALAGNPDYTTIINAQHSERLNELLADAKARGATLVPLTSEEPTRDRCMPPCLILNPTDDMRIMREEIFGPVLPIKTWSALDDALAYVNARPHPLALYYFGYDRRRIDRVIAGTMSGSMAINDTVVQKAPPALPFGGVGNSGTGQYNGKFGFLTFSKQKAVFFQSRWSSLGMLRPPYAKLADRVLKFLIGN